MNKQEFKEQTKQVFGDGKQITKQSFDTLIDNIVEVVPDTTASSGKQVVLSSDTQSKVGTQNETLSLTDTGFGLELSSAPFTNANSRIFHVARSVEKNENGDVNEEKVLVQHYLNGTSRTFDLEISKELVTQIVSPVFAASREVISNGSVLVSSHTGTPSELFLMGGNPQQMVVLNVLFEQYQNEYDVSKKSKHVGKLTVAGVKPVATNQFHGFGQTPPSHIKTPGSVYTDLSATNGLVSQIYDGRRWRVLSGDTGWVKLQATSLVNGYNVYVRRVNDTVTWSFGREYKENRLLVEASGSSKFLRGDKSSTGVISAQEKLKTAVIVDVGKLPNGFNPQRVVYDTFKLYNNASNARGTIIVANGLFCTSDANSWWNANALLQMGNISYVTDADWPEKIN